MGLLAIILSPVVGRNVHRVDPRVFATASFMVFALVMLMRSHFSTLVDFGTIMVPTIVQGAAVAFFFIPLVTLTLSGLKPDQVPAAMGLSNFVRITAGSFGTSITTTLWDHRASLHHAQLVEHITGYDPVPIQALASLQASGMSREQGYAMLDRMINQQAFMRSADDVFYASALLFLLLIAVVWLARPARESAGAADAAGAH